MKKIILVLLCLSIMILFDRTAQSEVRTWTSVDGFDRIEAELISINDYSVKLRRNDNNEVVTIDFRILSKNDKEFINRYEIEQEKEKQESLAKEKKARDDETLRKGMENKNIRKVKENEIRTWTLGKDQIEAELIEISKDGKSVTLWRNDRKEERILLEKLSENDRKFVAQYKIRKERERQEYWKAITAKREENEQARAFEREGRARAREAAEREQQRRKAMMIQEAQEKWEREAPLREARAQLREQQKQTEAIKEQTKAIDKQTQTIRDLKKK